MSVMRLADRDALAERLGFFRSAAHVLRRRPHLMAQEAADLPATSDLGTAARSYLAERGSRWFDWLNRPQQSPPCFVVLDGHDKAVNDCDVSPDGAVIASACHDGGVRLWSQSTGELRVERYVRDGAAGGCHFANQRLLIVRDAEAVEVWDAQTLQLQRRFETPKATCFAVSPDGTHVAIGSWTSVSIWKTTGTSVCAFDEPECGTSWTSPRIESVAFSPDGRELLVAVWQSMGGFLRIRGIASARERLTLNVSAVKTCAWSPDGRIVAAVQESTVQLLDARTGQPRRELGGHDSRVTSCAFSVSGHWLVTGCEDEQVRVWDVATGALRAALRGHTGIVTACRVLSTNTILSSSRDRTVRLWRVSETAALDADRLPDDIHRCLFLPGDRIVSAGQDRTIRVSRRSTQKVAAAFPDQPLHVLACTATADGSLLAVALCPLTGGERATPEIRILDLRANRLARTVELMTYRVSACHFAPGGRWIVAASANDGYLFVIDAYTGRTAAHYRAHDASALECPPAPDGRHVATSGGDGSVALWEAGTWNERWRIQLEHPQSRYAATTCAFSPDGRFLATGTHGGRISLWHSDTGELERELAALDQEVFACRFSADGTALSAITGELLVVLDLGTGAVIAEARAADPYELQSDPAAALIAVPETDRFRLLRLRGAVESPPVVTLSYRFNDDQGDWNRHATLICPGCGREQNGECGRLAVCEACRLGLKLNPFVADARRWMPATT